MDEYGAILHQRWTTRQDGTEIVGTWAEDGSVFKMTVPYQLRDLIVSLQNRLSDTYNDIASKRRHLADLELNVKKLLG